MSIALVVIYDGRNDYMVPAISSLDANIDLPFSPAIVIDDSGDAQCAAWLDETFQSFTIWHHGGQRRGLAAAVRDGWEAAISDRSVEFVWHYEQDFVLKAPVDVEAMATLLTAEPSLAQLVLKRDPWSQLEKDAGGQMEIAPDEYLDCGAILTDVESGEGHEFYWTEHITENAKAQHVFSFNPMLVRRDVIELCLAEPGDGLERGFTDTVLSHGLKLAYWGRRSDPPLAEHIGVSRSAGYRL